MCVCVCVHGWGAWVDVGLSERDPLAAVIARCFFERSANSLELLLARQRKRGAGLCRQERVVCITDATDATVGHASDNGMLFALLFRDAGSILAMGTILHWVSYGR